MKLTLEEFLKYFKAIKVFRKEQKDFNKGLDLITRNKGSYSDFAQSLFDSYVKMLENLMEDEYGNIDYYIYEIDMGKKGTNCISLEDGTKVSLRTPRELYKFLVSK